MKLKWKSSRVSPTKAIAAKSAFEKLLNFIGSNSNGAHEADSSALKRVSRPRSEHEDVEPAGFLIDSLLACECLAVRLDFY
jgi:hypothetical protein